MWTWTFIQDLFLPDLPTSSASFEIISSLTSSEKTKETNGRVAKP